MEDLGTRMLPSRPCSPLVRSVFNHHSDLVGRFEDPDTDTTNYRFSELFVFILLGCLGGLLGAVFNSLNGLFTKQTIQSTFLTAKILRVIWISMLMTVVAFFMSLLCGTCKPIPVPELTWSEQQKNLSSQVLHLARCGISVSASPILLQRQRVQ